MPYEEMDLRNFTGSKPREAVLRRHQENVIEEADPAAPNEPAPVSAFKSLNFLYKISGNKTITGIHNREPNATPARWTDEVFSTTGKYPGLWSGDFLFQAENIDSRGVIRSKKRSTNGKSGSIVNIMWQACLQPRPFAALRLG